MELWLLVKLIQRLDGLTQKSIGRVIGDFERFLIDPAAYLAKEPITIGPRRRYFSRCLWGLGAGYVGALVTVLLIALASEAAGNPPGVLPEPSGLVALAAFVVCFFAVFRWLRGGRCVLSADAVELHYHGDVVICPWNLFQTAGRPHTLPGKDFVLLPVAPAAVPLVGQRGHGDESRAFGLDIQTPHWRFQGATQAMLKPVYEVDGEELGQLLLGLGRLLARSGPELAAADTEEYASAAPALALPADKGWILLQLTRLSFPPYCCDCLQFTRTTETFATESSLTSAGAVKIRVPVCFECQGRARRRRRKAILLGMAAAFACGLVLSLALGSVNRNADLSPLVVIVPLVTLPLGAVLGNLLLHRSLARFRYHAGEGTISARFHSTRYTDYLLSVRLQEV